MGTAEFFISKKGDLYGGLGYYDPNDKTYNTYSTEYEISENYSSSDNAQGSNGWEITGQITEAGEVAYETTEQTVIGAQKLANRMAGTSSDILTGGELQEEAGTGLAILGAVLTIADGLHNGFKPHHVADLVVDATIYIVSASVPVAGWVVGGLWFVGNLISQETTGKSLTENMFDAEQ